MDYIFQQAKEGWHQGWSTFWAPFRGVRSLIMDAAKRGAVHRTENKVG